jgi:hypothetical protein
MGKMAILGISGKQELCAYRDQFPLASQQEPFFLLGQPISQRCTGFLKHRWEIFKNVRQGPSKKFLK